MRLYQALALEQIEQLRLLLHEFNQTHRKDKKLYELDYRLFDINPFQRNTNTSIYCIRQDTFAEALDLELAKSVLSHSFGQKTIEFR